MATQALGQVSGTLGSNPGSQFMCFCELQTHVRGSHTYSLVSGAKHKFLLRLPSFLLFQNIHLNIIFKCTYTIMTDMYMYSHNFTKCINFIIYDT